MVQQAKAADMISDGRVEIVGIPVDNLTESEALDRIQSLINAGGNRYAAVVNAAKLSLARRNLELTRILKSADLVTADGMSVVWASRVLGRQIKGRVTGIDLMCKIVEQAEQLGQSVYFLGAVEESVRGTVDYFASKFPRLQVAGYHIGYFTSADSSAVAGAIRRTGADILFVAMGSPAQEIWIDANLAATGVHFAIGVGGSFDHISGRLRRAPHWMQRAGLEWSFRLASEPRRLWRRYLIGNAVFIALVLKQLFRS
jgi:N-acetylglucosaminyldiphosphoundecaprenol N-acetyl-beta-D-mannosaminyltransferase